MRCRPDHKKERARRAAKRQQITRMAHGLAVENQIRQQIQARRAERLALGNTGGKS